MIKLNFKSIGILFLSMGISISANANQADSIMLTVKATASTNQSIHAVDMAKILSAYDTWWSQNTRAINFQGQSYNLIANDGSGQGSGSVYTSEGIGMGMLTSAMMMYLYQTQPSLGITNDEYNLAKQRFFDGYNYWVSAENSQAEKNNKSQWGCYDDKLLVWTRDAEGNPNGTGSATDGDFYMTGAVYLAVLALEKANDTTDANQLLAWAQARAAEISARDFNDGLSYPYTGVANPTLPGTGDSTCDKELSAAQNVQPDKAVLPVMYLFAKNKQMDQKTWNLLIDNTLKFIQTAQQWSNENRPQNGYLMYWPYTAKQSGNDYIITAAGDSYDYDAGRNPENLGGYLALAHSDYNSTAVLVDNQLLGAIYNNVGNYDSFYAGTTALGLYGLSTKQALTDQQAGFYNTLIAKPVDNKYYNTGHWLMSALWMHIQLQ
ncbi:hypothetical protein L3V82_04510 [Thiotrichales bacterium 19S3-7]|nr:hypothetical protein [Thiotrichales bacterium 19S3-7]MCF6801358.1 hypothetical protein [Thiotrichales bacterium 19S3-11]